MTEKYPLEIDSLAVGLTRPATIRGVPLYAFYLSVFSCLLGCMYFQAFTGSLGLKGLIIFFGIWVFIYTYMFFITYSDPYGLSIIWLNLTNFRKNQTFSFWNNTDSFAP